MKWKDYEGKLVKIEFCEVGKELESNCFQINLGYEMMLEGGNMDRLDVKTLD